MAGHMAHVGKMKNVYRILVGKHLREESTWKT